MHFLVVMAKNGENSVDFLCCRFDWWIHTMNWVFTNGSKAFGQARFLLSMSILSIKNKKPLTDGSITSMKMRPKVWFDTIDIDPLIHHRLCPAMNPVHRWNPHWCKECEKERCLAVQAKSRQVGRRDQCQPWKVWELTYHRSQITGIAAVLFWAVA